MFTCRRLLHQRFRRKAPEVLRKGLSELETGAEQMERKGRHELQIVNTGEQSKPQIQINATEEFRFGPYISSTLCINFFQWNTDCHCLFDLAGYFLSAPCDN